MKEYWNKVGDFLEEYGWMIGVSLIVLGLGVFKIFFDDIDTSYKIILVLFAFLLYGFFQYRLLKFQKSKLEIESKKEHFEKKSEQLEESVERWKNGFDEFFRNSLIFLYNSYEFDERDRISVYRHEENRFILVGRYSKNPRFNAKGRESYPDDEGFIAMGWSHGESCRVIEADPDTNFNEYASEVMDECNIKKGTLNALSMKSRSYCINDITMPVTQEKIGVIVLESIEIGRFGEDDAEKAAARINELFYAYIICKKEC